MNFRNIECVFRRPGILLYLQQFTGRSLTAVFVAILIITCSGILHSQDPCDCENNTRAADSIRLMKFYTDMDGGNWRVRNGWLDEGVPINEWDGVIMSADGNSVSCLDLDGNVNPDRDANNCGNCEVNNIGGTMEEPNMNVSTWPIDFFLPCLKRLSLVLNPLDEMPDFICFSSMCRVFLQETGLKGEIDPEKFDNPELIILNMNGNQLQGGIPADLLTRLPLLKTLFLEDNDLDGTIPDVSASDIGLFNITGNRLTFEDLLPHFTANSANPLFAYNEQQKVFRKLDTTATFSLPFSISLGIDEAVPDNVYSWRRTSGVTITDLPLSNSNTLNLGTLSPLDTGLYICTVTNPQIPLLTLTSHPIRIRGCDPGKRSIDTTICPGTVFEFAPGVSFSQDTLYRLPVSAFTGCDSVLDLRLNFYPAAVNVIDTIICIGDVVTIDGQGYSQAGVYSIPIDDLSQNGCDSLIELIITEATTTIFGSAAINSDPLACQTDHQLIGVQPPGTFGRWLLPPWMNADDLNDPTPDLSGWQPGFNQIGWALGAGGCPAYDTVFQDVFFEPPFGAINDTIWMTNDYRLDFLSDTIDLIKKDTGVLNPVSDFIFNLIDSVELGTIILPDPDQPYLIQYEREPGYGTYQVRYTLGGEQCPADTATLFINIESNFLGIDQLPPNVITPNGDGINDSLIIPLIKLNPRAFPESELLVYDPNGSLLFTKQNYQNDWQGTMPDGRPLTGGHGYLYIIVYGQGLPPHKIRLSILYSKEN